MTVKETLSVAGNNNVYWTPLDVAKALTTMKNKGLCLIKGDIGYGFFGTTDEAIQKMYRLKGRPHSNPVIIIGSMDVVKEVAVTSPEILQWIEEVSELTTIAVVLPANKNSKMLNALPEWLYGQTVTNDSVAIFLNVGPFLKVLVREAFTSGHIFVGTSANISSHGNTFRFEDLPAKFLENIEFYLDHGNCKYENKERKATTIVNFTNWSIKREGVNYDLIKPRFDRIKEQILSTVEA